MLRFVEYAVQPDITRYNRSAKVVDPYQKQLKFIRSGVADVVVDECVKAEVLKIFSLEDLEALEKDVSYLEVLEKTMKTFKEE